MSHLGNSSVWGCLLRNLETTLVDRLEQGYRLAKKLVRPFRYWNLFSLLKAAEHFLYVNGAFFFLFSNRLLLRGSAPSARQQRALFRRPASTLEEAWAPLFWLIFTLCGGYPFFTIRHPSIYATSWLRRRLHPTIYWSFLGAYKVVFSTLRISQAVWWLTDPRTSPSWLRWIHRERILQLNNVRYRRDWSALQKQLFDLDNKNVRYLQIGNKWVAFGSLGSAVHDVIDEAREIDRLTSTQLKLLFGRMGSSLRKLEDVSISMTLPLPLMAVGQLLRSARNLKHLRLDGVALSVQDLQQDIVELGRILHGVSMREASSLQSLKMENCWLVDDEMDPQIRQRYSLDLLLSPAILTAMTPPTSLHLQHLTLYAKCQMISALEIAVMLRVNTSLKSLFLGLRHDSDEAEMLEDEEEDDDDWFIVPLCQVLQYSNRTLQKLTLHLTTGIQHDSFSDRALKDMMKDNDVLQEINMIRTDQQLRIRIPEVEFYLHLNQLGRQQFRLHFDTIPKSKWINLIISEKQNTAVVYYFLSLYPTLVGS